MPSDASFRLRTPRTFNPVARERFARNRRKVLRAHLGREPSITEQILISRVISVEWELLKTDARVQAGEELSPHAARTRLAAEQRLRLDLRELGLAPRKPAEASWQDTLAAFHGKEGKQ